MNSKSHDQIQKLALTALFRRSVLCYLYLPADQDPRYQAEMQHPFISETHSVYWQHCFLAAYTEVFPEQLEWESQTSWTLFTSQEHRKLLY